MPGPQAELIQLIEAYFAAQSDFDGETMASFWHPTGKMYLVGNSNEFRVVSIEEQTGHIKAAKERQPEINVQFTLDEIEQVVVHDDLIASVHVRWRMVFPEGYGQHRTFFNLAKIAGKWGIVNTVDRGIQVTPDE